MQVINLHITVVFDSGQFAEEAAQVWYEAAHGVDRSPPWPCLGKAQGSWIAKGLPFVCNWYIE